MPVCFRQWFLFFDCSILLRTFTVIYKPTDFFYYKKEFTANFSLAVLGALISYCGAGFLATSAEALSKFCGGVGGASLSTVLGIAGLADKFKEIDIAAGDTVTVQQNTIKKYDGSEPIGSSTNTFILRVYNKDMKVKYEEKLEY